VGLKRVKGSLRQGTCPDLVRCGIDLKIHERRIVAFSTFR